MTHSLVNKDTDLGAVRPGRPVLPEVVDACSSVPAPDAGNRTHWSDSILSAAAILVLVLLFVLLSAAMASASNSPRPATWSATNGQITLTWTNLSSLHPWLLSYADAPGAWRWETERLHASAGRLTVTRPMDRPMRLFRLWPAAP